MADDTKTPMTSEEAEALQKKIAELEADNAKLKVDIDAEKTRADEAEKEAKAAVKGKGKVVASIDATIFSDTGQKPGAEMEELVTIHLFKDKDRYKDDVEITVNGERILIQRGVDVKIKRKYAEIWEQTVAQDRYADSTIERFGDEYREVEKKYT